ncbi:MAG: ACT domain-containing protein [Lachnospiraceae bacterium]|nr:ACT domain-containing protein [Lachnospiraceae bacterium]
MKKVIIVVYGKDKSGIIYNITKILYENAMNVLDIKQTIVGGYFNMMTVADCSKTKALSKVKSELDKYSKKSNLSINMHLEEAFDTMHNV